MTSEIRPIHRQFLILLMLAALFSCHSKVKQQMSADQTENSQDKNQDKNIVGGYEFDNPDADLFSTSRNLVMLIAPTESRGQQVCTATRITEKALLTAGHCVVDEAIENPGRVRAFLGASPLRGPKPERVLIQKIIRHPEYKKNNRERNDLAILLLQAPLITQVQLPTLAHEKKQTQGDFLNPVYVMGFGVSNDSTQMSHLDSFQRGAGTLRWTSLSQTKDDFAEKGFVLKQEGGSGACFGDSGGPAFTQNESSEWVLIGVASAVFDSDEKPFSFEEAPRECSSRSFYMNVSEYDQWIKKSLENSNELSN